MPSWGFEWSFSTSRFWWCSNLIFWEGLSFTALNFNTDRQNSSFTCAVKLLFLCMYRSFGFFFPLSQNELVNFSPLHLGDLCKKMEAEWVNQCWEFPMAGVCLVRWGFKWLFYNNDCFFSFFVLPKAWATMFRLDLGVCSFWNIWGFLWLNRGHSLLSMYMNSRNLLSTFLWTF